MKLCLCFHCLCQSYEQIPSVGQELFVSLSDLEIFLYLLSERGYDFTNLEDPSSDTVTVTFDDGYQNNLLFQEISQSRQIPYLIFIPSFYVSSGIAFPWMRNGGINYSQMHTSDLYSLYEDEEMVQEIADLDDFARPMTMAELKQLGQDSLVEIGAHGHYHQPLSKGFESYIEPERDRCLSILGDHLGVTPRYFSLANGMYTKRTIQELLKTFKRVLTIEGRPYRHKDNLVHRITLINPNIGGPLIHQLDLHLNLARQTKRALKTYFRLRL